LKENEMAKMQKGFAVMDPQRQREIASQGGKTAHLKGTANRFSSEAASKAATLGWEKRRAKQGLPPAEADYFTGGLLPDAFGPHRDNTPG
jgi:hypothetical protein